MAGQTSAENGRKGGRPKGKKSRSTLEKEKVLAAFKQIVMKRAMPLFHAQYLNAMGTTHLYRIDERKGGHREHVLVTDEWEIRQFLDERGEDGSGKIDEKYYYISTKDPDNKAIDSLLDRAFGKASQPLSGDKDNPILIKGVNLRIRK